MTGPMTQAIAAALREPFKDHEIGKLPKVWCSNCREAHGKVCDRHRKIKCEVCNNLITSGHMHVDYVGHAEITDRLLQVDPLWSWEPVAWTPDGLPRFDTFGGIWIKLTVAGMTRLGYGHPDGKKTADGIKEAIGDALRNASMRFGVGLDMWGAKFTPAEDAAEPDPADGELAVPPPKATDVRDWALKPGRTTAELDAAARRLHGEHPAVFAEEIVNEHGDDERLGSLIARRAREAEPATAPVDEQPATDTAPGVTDHQHRHMHALWREIGYSGDENREQRLTVIRSTIRRDIDSSKELSEAEADAVIERLKARRAQIQGASA